MQPIVRVEEAGLGPQAPVRAVLSGLEQLEAIQRQLEVSGVTVECRGARIRVTAPITAVARAFGRALGPQAGDAMAGQLGQAVAGWCSPTTTVQLASGDLSEGDGRPLVMGIINVTPDSFSDGGQLYPDGHPDAAIAAGTQMAAAGAQILDVGGESTRPGSEPVSEDEELARVVPVVSGLAGSGVPVSIDTMKPAVARAAVDAGAAVINDVSGAHDPDLLAVAAESSAAYVLMHTRGTPATMPGLTDYDDVVAEVYEFLAQGVDRCVAAGVPRERILVDPGIGFAKTPAQSFALMAALRQFTGLRCPVLVGASRKRFLGTVAPQTSPPDRLAASLTCAVTATLAGAAVIRVHDVAATVQAVATATAIRGD